MISNLYLMAVVQYQIIVHHAGVAVLQFGNNEVNEMAECSCDVDARVRPPLETTPKTNAWIKLSAFIFLE